jgi:hypothetical protein
MWVFLYNIICLSIIFLDARKLFGQSSKSCNFLFRKSSYSQNVDESKIPIKINRLKRLFKPTFLSIKFYCLGKCSFLNKINIKPIKSTLQHYTLDFNIRNYNKLLFFTNNVHVFSKIKSIIDLKTNWFFLVNIVTGFSCSLFR